MCASGPASDSGRSRIETGETSDRRDELERRGRARATSEQAAIDELERLRTRRPGERARVLADPQRTPDALGQAGALLGTCVKNTDNSDVKRAAARSAAS